MIKYFYPLLIVLSVSCSQNETFTRQDEKEIHAIRNTYTNGWLAGDEETVLGLFTEEATIIPDGMKPVRGKQAIKNYWFPSDSSETIIHSYGIELMELYGTDSMAYTLEKGELSFTYRKGDFTMTRESTSHASTVYRKQEDGRWKIVSRMWTAM